MKKSTTKHTPETSVIYKSNDDITVISDLALTKKFEKELNQELIVLKEEKMGYGIIITKNKEFATFGNGIISGTVISAFWDEYAERIEEEIRKTDDFSKLVALAIATIVACTRQWMHTMKNQVA